MKTKKPILRTILSGAGIAVLIAVLIATNTLIPPNMNMINAYLGDKSEVQVERPETADESLDLVYSKSDLTKEEMAEAEPALNREIVGEGIVLLKNDGLMPFEKGTKFSFFGHSSTFLVGNAYYDLTLKMTGMSGDRGMTLREAFKEEGFDVNDQLWKFYLNGKGFSYRLGYGSLDYGDAEDFSINECPLDELKKETGLLESADGTVPVFVLRRLVGEGRDMPRSMYNHTSIPEDQSKSYLEPDSVELEILQYLDDHYDNVVLLVTCSAAMELGWVEQFPSIKSIVFVPSTGNNGLASVADIFSGAINPSGRITDTFALDAFSSPASVNFGDFQYTDESGVMTKYNYVAYTEGIYVGYRYYETRYEDVVMGQGNAGDYDYAATVLYPFGYGIGYTTFDWSNYQTVWDGEICTVTVDVTNTGNAAGKDVVQIYAQSPYTDYDRQNNVEKASVVLVGFEKTKLLQPKETQTVTVTFSRQQLTSYDYISAKTYILDAGDYYITAGKNAHEAVNNILSAKGYKVANGMTADGDSALVSLWHNDALDIKTYSVNDRSGETITNQFDFAHGGYTYLSRSDWQGTWPRTDGTVSDVISTWGNPINGADGKSYVYTKKIDADGLKKLDSFDSLNPVDPSSIKDMPTYINKTGVQLIDLRGKDYDDPLWNNLLDNLSADEYQTLVTASGYGTKRLITVMKPSMLDQDGPLGLSAGGTGYQYSGAIVLAQSWNKDLALQFGNYIGNEANIGKCVGWYAPAMNIHRTPFSGRNSEYYSEDGFLSGTIASQEVRGAAAKGMVTFLKHFALNDQENHRGDRGGQYGLATWSNEQAIREIYLKPFELCVTTEDVPMNYIEAQEDGTFVNKVRDIPAVNAIMTSFNRIGYTWAGGCYPLLTNVLRGEWGFNGFILTDNSNFGSATFMNAYQMIEAGADGELTNENYATWEFEPDNPAHYHYARQAAHHLLYMAANSKAMNGMMPGAVIRTEMTLAEKIVIGINIGAGVLIALLTLSIVLGFVKYSKRKRQEQI